MTSTFYDSKNDEIRKIEKIEKQEEIKTLGCKQWNLRKRICTVGTYLFLYLFPLFLSSLFFFPPLNFFWVTNEEIDEKIEKIYNWKPANGTEEILVRERERKEDEKKEKEREEKVSRLKCEWNK